MQNYEFVTWLEGYFDLCSISNINNKKLQIIKNHLNLVIAVEGELGPLNQEIYDLISKAIKEGDEKITLNCIVQIEKKLRLFLEQAFPESHNDAP